MWQLEYSYDGQVIGDLFAISDGCVWSKPRNDVSQINFNVSLRKIQEWCVGKNFDVKRMFTPIRSSIKLIAPSGAQVIGGWLSATPPFAFGAAADAVVQFTFTGWIGLCAGAFLIPPYSYNKRFDLVANDVINIIVARTTAAGAKWPITLGPSDELAVVEDVLEAPKTLKDLLLERTDNTTGIGTFDVYDDPSAQITLHEHYGLDISDSTTFTYPDMGSKFDLKEISFDPWDNYVSDIFLTGAGNGYQTTSGFEGAAIFAEQRNVATIANTGYWQHAVSESDVSVQATLNAKATSYVKDTDKPFISPTLHLDGDRFEVYSRDQGGDLWLGDTIMVDVAGWVKPLLPIELPEKLRINQIDATVDKVGHLELSLGMISG